MKLIKDLNHEEMKELLLNNSKVYDTVIESLDCNLCMVIHDMLQSWDRGIDYKLFCRGAYVCPTYDNYQSFDAFLDGCKVLNDDYIVPELKNLDETIKLNKKYWDAETDKEADDIFMELEKACFDLGSGLLSYFESVHFECFNAETQIEELANMADYGIYENVYVENNTLYEPYKKPETVFFNNVELVEVKR